MHTSVFLAQVWGIVLTLAGLGMLLNGKHYLKVIESYEKNAGLLYIGGIFGLILGIIQVQAHSIWTGGWPVVLTVLGWILLVKGAIWVAFPVQALSFIRAKQSPSIVTAGGILGLVLGIFLLYVGF